jgi:hypothetical protein
MVGPVLAFGKERLRGNFPVGVIREWPLEEQEKGLTAQFIFIPVPGKLQA